MGFDGGASVSFVDRGLSVEKERGMATLASLQGGAVHDFAGLGAVAWTCVRETRLEQLRRETRDIR